MSVSVFIKEKRKMKIVLNSDLPMKYIEYLDKSLETNNVFWYCPLAKDNIMVIIVGSDTVVHACIISVH